MAVLEPTVALVTCERALRELMSAVFEAEFGSAWVDQVAKPVQVRSWSKKAAKERGTAEARGVVNTSSDPLDFAEFTELLAIAEAHWSLLAPCLGSIESTKPLLDRFEAVRNTVAHSRQLLKHEEELLSGIAGEIRNKVTIHMTARDEVGDHYARIESATDSYGNAILAQEILASGHPLCATGLSLRFGEIVTFRCIGSDPKGRPLHWELHTLPAGLRVSAEGDEVELPWVVDSVGTEVHAVIYMRSAGDFHRWEGTRDGIAMFRYRVDPPD